ncbi:MAG: histidine kinase [Saprospiraceae bacterium]|nr:histidine kinase [Saprospiraceae bacterium]
MRLLLFVLFLLCTLLPRLRAQTSRLDSLLTALNALPESGDTARLNARSALQFKIGSQYYKQKNYTESRRYYREGLRSEERLASPRGIAQGLSNIAYTYQMEGRFPEAVDSFLLAYRHWEAVRDTGKMSNTAVSISQIDAEIPGQTRNELEYARLCLQLAEQARRWHGVCACAHLVGDVYDKLGQPDSSVFFLQKSLTLLEKTPDPYGLHSLYLSLARVEARRQNPARELEWLLKADALLQQGQIQLQPDQLANHNLHLADACLRRGDTGKAALLLSDVQKNLIAGISDPTYRDRLYEHLSRLAEAQNRPADALRFYKMHIAARDSVQSLDNARRITRIQMTHDFERKQSALAAQQSSELALRDARSRQNNLIFLLVTLGLLGGGALGFYTYRQRQERRRSELELASLRAQINPHFIFNCLNSIYRYTKERDTDTAGKYLQKFSSLLRLVLENSRVEKITLARDLEALQLYVDIESLRFKDKLQFSLYLDPEIDPGFVQIPGMLIQPHVENAIWHGLLHRPEGGRLAVRITQPTETLLRVEVEDDGIGRRAAGELASRSALNKKSLGQKITTERLLALGKLAHSETIDLSDAQGNPAGTRVILDIPL